MTDLEYFIKLIDDYRDELADRRDRKEHYRFIELNDKGYINAMTEVIVDLHEIMEKCKKMVELHENTI